MEAKNVIIKTHGEKDKYFFDYKVDAAHVSALIGIGGCNIRRITSTIKNGCYIRADNNIFNISAYSFSALEKAIKMLKSEETALKNNDIASSKPHGSYKVYTYLVPYIVGKNGDGLRMIMSEIDDGCYIVHKDKEFKITANTIESVNLAIQKIKDIASKYLSNHMETRGKSKNKNKNKNDLPNDISTINNNTLVTNVINTKKRQSLDNSFNQLSNDDDINMSLDNTDVEDNDSYMLPSTPPKKIKKTNGVWNNSQQTNQVINNVINSDFKDSNKVIQTRILEEEKKKEEILNNQIANNIKNGVPVTYNLDNINTVKKPMFSKSWADVTDDEEDDDDESEMN